MNGTESTIDRPSDHPAPTLIQAYARLAGALFLLSMLVGIFGELYVPSRLVVPGDAAATANNVVTLGALLRLGFACYLVEALCDITLSWVLYVLLRPAHKQVALLAAFFALVGTAVFAGAELFFFAASFILGGADYLKSFSSQQVSSLGMLSLTFYKYGTGLFMVFYGAASVLRGWLIYRSGYLPRSLGALLAVAGGGLIVRNFLLVLAPAYAAEALLMPLALAGLLLGVWLLMKGVDVQRWRSRAPA